MPPTFFERWITGTMEKRLKPNKVLILYGARRVGKTELIKNFVQKFPAEEYLLLNGEDQDTARLLADQSIANYRRLLAGKTLLIIDEAQAINNIGRKLKLMVDEIKGIRVIATGSSVFDLSNKLGEPLVGRKRTLQLHPLAQMELRQYENLLQTKAALNERLVYGSYPELWQLESLKEKQEYLTEMVDSYLLKDILSFEGIRKPDKIYDLLRLLSFQVGKEVSIHELANNLSGISRNTVEHYLDLLTKVFVIHSVGGYSGNLRKEVTKNKRWYFYDNGVRNAIIRNFNLPGLRNDIGALWENYLVSERIKYQDYTEMAVSNYYWRTYDRQELDWIEREDSGLSAFEFKWNENRNVKAPEGWSRNYPEAAFRVINPANYLEWIS